MKHVTSNKNELNELSKNTKAISTNGLTKDLANKFSILNKPKYFPSGVFQSYLVFIPATKHLIYFHGTTQLYFWKSKGMSEESIENITKSGRNFAPTFDDHHSLPDIKFNGHCLIKNSISIPRKVKNRYISYTLGWQLRNLNTGFTLSNYLFGSVKWTTNADLYKYKCTGYGIGFDSRGEYSLPESSIGKNVIIFGVDMSSSVHIANKGKDILILGKEPTEGLYSTIFTAEAKYPINFTESGKGFVLSLHYNGSNSFFFVNATKVYQFKSRDSEIKDYALCLGNVLKDFAINNMKKAGLKGVVKFFLLTLILSILTIL